MAIAERQAVTYSPSHVADGDRFDHLLIMLDRDLTELRQMASAYSDAVTMPGRRPDVDADGTGRRATSGPTRPTERTALDEDRTALVDELNSGIPHLIHAIAHVRGVTASMDRALLRWEGEDEVWHTGSVRDHFDGTADDR